MKYFSLCPFILALSFATFGFGQNLVPNPSFEEYLECPLSTAEFQTQVVSWYSFAGTPDYFNICNNEGIGTAGVPNNAAGFQEPITGNAYSSLITYTSTAENEREYITCELTTPLSVGQEYYVMFYISHFDGGEISMFRCASDKLGLKFFTSPSYGPAPTNPYYPENTADIEYNILFSDSSSWTLVEGWFTADESYTTLSIGNFYDDLNTNIVEYGDPGNCISLIYIENICVAKNPESCQYLLSTHENTIKKRTFKVFPNPAYSELTIEVNEQKIVDIRLYNSLGVVVDQIFVNSNQTKISLANRTEGFYFLEIILDDNTRFKTKIIKL